MVRTLTYTAGGMGLIPGWGSRIPHAVWHSQKIKILLFMCEGGPIAISEIGNEDLGSS